MKKHIAFLDYIHHSSINSTLPPPPFGSGVTTNEDSGKTPDAEGNSGTFAIASAGNEDVGGGLEASAGISASPPAGMDPEIYCQGITFSTANQFYKSTSAL